MLKPSMEIITESFHLYLKNFRTLVPYLAIMFLPTLILSVLGTISLYLEIYIPASNTISNIILLVLTAASIVIYIWTSIAIIRALNAILLNQPLDWKENFKTSNHLILPFIWVSILTTLIILGGSLLFIIPGIIFAVWYTFAAYSAVIDGNRGMQALSASKLLVVGRWAKIAWRLVVIGVIFGILLSLISFLLSLPAMAIPGPDFLQSALSSLISSLIGAILSPLSVAALIILYHNAKENPVGSETHLTPPQV